MLVIFDCAGPVRMEAVFFNKEEVDLVPIYRDPIHDFGTSAHRTWAAAHFHPTLYVQVYFALIPMM